MTTGTKRGLLGMGWRGRGGRLIIGIAGLLTFALAGCQALSPASLGPAKTGGAGGAGGGAQEIHVLAKEWGFSPTKLTLPVGRPVTIVFDNQGQILHDLTIPDLNVKLVADAGKSAQATITTDKAGAHDLTCSVPGHKEAGMKGQADVIAGAARESAQSDKAAASAVAHASHAAVATTATRGNQLLQYRMDGDVKVFDVKAQHVKWEVLPGEFVDAYSYSGQVPGPVLRVTEGDKVRVDFTNELPEATVIHFHGNTLPNTMDGVPDVTQRVVEPGQQFRYEFVAKPAGTFVYHTHHNSASQEPKGLYGVFIVDPKGGPTVKADKEAIQVISELGGYYVINGKAFPATEPIEAKVGEKVLIRLVNLGQMPHPMHLHGMPFKIVATDGHPVPAGLELTKDVINIGPGERYDLLIEADNPGTWVFHCHILGHVQNHGVEPGGMITVFKVTEK